MLKLRQHLLRSTLSTDKTPGKESIFIGGGGWEVGEWEVGGGGVVEGLQRLTPNTLRLIGFQRTSSILNNTVDS